MSRVSHKMAKIAAGCVVLLAAHAFSSPAPVNLPLSWYVDLSGTAIANQYAYNRVGDQDTSHEGTWINTVNNTHLEHVYTFQFTSSTLDNPSLTVMPLDAGNTDNCMEVFSHNEQTTAVLNTPVLLSQLFPDLTTRNSATPIHLTVIPYYSTDLSCPMPASLAADTVLSVFYSDTAELPTMNPAIHHAVKECDLKGPLTVADLPLTSPTGCDLEKPSWSLVSPVGSNASYYLKYSGPLVNMIPADPSQQEPIVIHLADDADIQFPMTTQYVEYPVTTPAVPATCESELLNYNNSSPRDLNSFPYNDCGLSSATALFVPTSDDYQRSYTYSEPMTQPIYVTGFGRIDGTAAIKKYLYIPPAPNPLNAPADRPCHTPAPQVPNNLGSIYPCYIPTTSTDLAQKGGDFVSYAQWRIDTSLLGLSSSYTPPSMTSPSKNDNPSYQGTDPAIAVVGITVADTPIRNRGTVQLNVAQFGQKDSREANNTPVIVNDFKQLGSWMDASDGPDIGSDAANEQNLYYQITDDSAKLEAKNQYLHNVTLIQGGVGGIMLGMYGVTRDGIDYSIVDGVSVPRIIEQSNFIPPSSTFDPYGSTHGLVSTRTCPRYFQGSEQDTPMPSLSNATVENVRVFGLTVPSVLADEPNYLIALASVGVAGSSIYCSTDFDTKTLAPSFTFGPLNLYSLQSDITPQEPFVFYNQPGNATQTGNTVSVTWNPINFNSDVTQSAKYYASGTGESSVYNYICPVDNTSTNPKCMHQIGSSPATGVSENKVNLKSLIGQTSFGSYPHT
jgi:hypothetical protein